MHYIIFHNRGLRRIYIGIVRYAYRAHGISFRWAVARCGSVATGLLKIIADFLSKKNQKPR